MVTTLIALCLTCSFPTDLPMAEFEAGKRQKSLIDISGPSRIKIGTWFDGSKKRVVEEALILSPGFVARRLGYATMREGYTDETARSEWSRFATVCEGKTLMLIRLARLDTVELSDGDIRPTSDPTMLDQPAFEFRLGGDPFQKLAVRKIQDVIERRPDIVLRDDIESVLSHHLPWPKPPTANELVSTIRWGKNRVVTWLAELPRTNSNERGDLKITEPDRTRIIKFRFPPG